MMDKLLLFVAILILGACATCPEDDVQLVKWSEWDNKPTSDGESVTIGLNDKILLDESPVELNILTIEGLLVVDTSEDAYIELDAQFIYVEGHFVAGTHECRLNGHFTITMIGEKLPNESPNGVGTKVLGGIGSGTIEIHGQERPITWTQLAKTAIVNDDEIELVEEVDWKVGEEIVIASTDYHYTYIEERQSERRTISHINGKIIKFNEPLTYMHYGEIWSQEDDEIDMRGEVALITRNVLFQGDSASNDDYWGAHIMILPGATLRIDSVEIRRAGQHGELGRYPIHFHTAGLQDESYVVGNSIHDSYQRCVTVHGAQKLIVYNNVCYKSFGHLYFIEDGNEEENIFDHNIGIEAHVHNELLVSDTEPAVFWTVNPNNHYFNNVAVDAKFGFWYALPESPIGDFVKLLPKEDYMNRFKIQGDFIGNKAHSCEDGLFVDRGQTDPEGNTELSSYNPRDFTIFFDHVDSKDAILELSEYQITETGLPQYAVYEDFTAYKNSGHGMWGRGSFLMCVGSRLADNTVGALFPGTANFMIDTVFVGETANVGNQLEGWWGDQEGRSRPTLYWLDREIIGYSSYDAGGGDFIIDSRFYDYVDYEFTSSGRTRASGAFSGLTGPNVINPYNFYANNLFTNVDNKVQLHRYVPNGSTYVDLFSYDDAMKGFVLVDFDGSITGDCGSSIVGAGDHLRYSGCTYMTAWNAYHCPSDYYPHREFYFHSEEIIFGLDPENYYHFRQKSDARLVRLHDKAEVRIEANQELYGEGLLQANMQYGTNILANHEYFLDISDTNYVPDEFYFQLSGFEGDFMHLAVPYPSGSTFSITHRYASERNFSSVGSKAELDIDTYYFDDAANILWIHAEIKGKRFDWITEKIVQERNDIPIVVYATCPSSCQNAVFNLDTIDFSGPTGETTNLCYQYQHIIPGAETARLDIFTDEWNGWDVWNPSEVCEISDDYAADGSDYSFKCTFFNYDGTWDSYGTYSTSGLVDISPYTHVQMKVRLAEGYGLAELGFLYDWDSGISVLLHNPLYSEDGYSIDDQDWKLLTIPIEDLVGDATAIENLALYSIAYKPQVIYYDSIAFVTLDTTLATPKRDITLDDVPAPLADYEEFSYDIGSTNDNEDSNDADTPDSEDIEDENDDFTGTGEGNSDSSAVIYSSLVCVIGLMVVL
eukprot:TRINITY_DN6778_c0_g1_i1.p1 TRINITY_DN6778_c0_g1~~TRINITY_DN6778_c0_g1_i1.p1  ORF type:complete len:1165 (-),score=289.03 TRINITY_DN6778_c0_g1_i1:43-3537(-)